MIAGRRLRVILMSESLDRLASDLKMSWNQEEYKLSKVTLGVDERRQILYKFSDICTVLMRAKRGVAGDVARALGGLLVAPPTDPTEIKRHFGQVRGFSAMND